MVSFPCVHPRSFYKRKVSTEKIVSTLLIPLLMNTNSAASVTWYLIDTFLGSKLAWTCLHPSP